MRRKIEKTRRALDNASALILIVLIPVYGLFVWWTNQPVAVETRYDLRPGEDFTEIWMAWENQYDCKFDTVVALVGSTKRPDTLRTGLVLDFGKGVGSRRAGFHQVDPDDWWKIEKPSQKLGPEVIITAWHTCWDGVSRPSEMLALPFDEVFPGM